MVALTLHVKDQSSVLGSCNKQRIYESTNQSGLLKYIYSSHDCERQEFIDKFYGQ